MRAPYGQQLVLESGLARKRARRVKAHANGVLCVCVCLLLLRFLNDGYLSFHRTYRAHFKSE